LFGVSSLDASGALAGYQSSDRARTGWTPFDLRLSQTAPSSKMNGIRRRSESESHDVIARQQARPEFADVHLDEMSMIITEPDLLKRRMGLDLKVVIDAYCHQLLRFACTFDPAAGSPTGLVLPRRIEGLGTTLKNEVVYGRGSESLA